MLEIQNLLNFNPDRPIMGLMGLKVSVSGNTRSCYMEVAQSGYQTGKHWGWYYEVVRDAWPGALTCLKGYIEWVYKTDTL